MPTATLGSGIRASAPLPFTTARSNLVALGHRGETQLYYLAGTSCITTSCTWGEGLGQGQVPG
jgi:hypothetical protein